jgi:hypothetical protein
MLYHCKKNTRSERLRSYETRLRSFDIVGNWMVRSWIRFRGFLNELTVENITGSRQLEIQTTPLDTKKKSEL